MLALLLCFPFAIPQEPLHRFRHFLPDGRTTTLEVHDEGGRLRFDMDGFPEDGDYYVAFVLLRDDRGKAVWGVQEDEFSWYLTYGKMLPLHLEVDWVVAGKDYHDQADLYGIGEDARFLGLVSAPLNGLKLDVWCFEDSFGPCALLRATNAADERIFWPGEVQILSWTDHYASGHERTWSSPPVFDPALSPGQKMEKELLATWTLKDTDFRQWSLRKPSQPDGGCSSELTEWSISGTIATPILNSPPVTPSWEQATFALRWKKTQGCSLQISPNTPGLSHESGPL